MHHIFKGCAHPGFSGSFFASFLRMGPFNKGPLQSPHPSVTNGHDKLNYQGIILNN